MKSTILLLSSVFLLFCSTEIFAQKLSKDVKVYNIKTVDVVGNKINLHKILKDNDKVLICFFRPVWCPICNKRTHELIERYDELKKKGIEVLAIYPNNSETMAQYVKDAEIPFPVISDPNEVIYEKYAIERSAEKVQATYGQKEAKEAISEGQTLYAGKVYKEAGVGDKYEKIINADFLVGAKRVLEIGYYGEYIGDHYSLDKL
ncbi:MAG: Alkyl hydroperoxide reductase/ Thiol specific antioxidant/ Mal allergen [uncultured Aureispira sp.]|uniref:Alkyl hydroperoxide reductase/ Thiol specific antioxidant/ Mal allergen n=1 Tax=uncultured Aureispira sp. TaxID=1331704 RepID=A0A6S6SFA3_9BACT|nr:MAG: Alkyl hydroperoxide reductase/ Thiol specific antioxidant/ Mal allergen [uncultured Aureispira sp.]